MKKSSTFNLEQDIYDEIEAYKNSYKLSSRNIALERMLLERRMLINMKGITQNSTVAKNIDLDTKSSSVIDNSLKDSFNNMPD